MRSILIGTLTWLGLAATARAEEFHWLPAANTSSCPVTLDRPIPLTAKVLGSAASGPTTDSRVTAASYEQPGLYPPQPIIRAQAPDYPPPGPTLNPPPGAAVAPPPAAPFPPPPGPGAPYAPLPPPPVGNEPYNCGVVNQPPAPGGHPYWEKFRHWFDIFNENQPSGGRTLFQSDHSFDDVGFISPVSNPFLFEDPRALTEVRPIFIWQQTPSKNPIFHGGDIEYSGLQARLAITSWLDLDINKLGVIWSEVHDPTDGFHSHAGFAELWLGPKVTFYRCPQSGTVAAAGLTFQIPAGSSDVQQDTGSLSLEPYVSFAQDFGRSSYGSFNFMNTTGYSFSVDHDRTDYVFTSFHLDYDIARLHKIYPLIELNFFDFTTNGHTRPGLGFEGADLFNFGAGDVSGHTELNMALGLRYKFSECVQTGIVGEFPLLGNHELLDFRLTVDLIFRY